MANDIQPSWGSNVNTGYSNNGGIGNYGQDAREEQLRQLGIDVDRAKSELGSGYNDWLTKSAQANGIEGGTANAFQYANSGAYHPVYGQGSTGNGTGNRYTPPSPTGYDANGRPTGGQYSGGDYASRPLNYGQQNNTGAQRYGATDPYQLASGTDAFGNITTDMANEAPYDFNQINQSYTKNILQQYGSDTQNALKYMQQAGQEGITGYSGLNDFYQGASRENNALAQRQAALAESTYGGAYNAAKGAAGQALGYGMQAGQGQLADTGKMMGYYQRLAAQNQLPGQSLIEQNLGQNTAESVARMKEMGGNSMALLGATGNIYNQQQAGLRDVGLQAAQYQAGNQQAQAGAAQQAIGLRAGALNQMAGAQTGYGNAMQNAAAQYGGAQERYMANRQNAFKQGVGWQATGKEGLTNANMNAAGNMSDLYSNQATGTSDLLQSLEYQRRQAVQQQADLTRRAFIDSAGYAGEGQKVVAEAEDQSWQQNQYNQWANRYGYWGQQAGVDTQSAISNATQNATGIWGQQSQNNFNQQQLDLQRQQMIYDAIDGLGDSLSG